MRKIATSLTAGLFTVLSASAFACPKGSQIQGGTGPNHKGGKCVATGVVKTKKETTKATTTAKQEAVKTKDTTKHEAMKATTDTKKAASTTTTQVKQDAAKTVKTH
ncbi:hypothetical protein [Acinetobacter sp. TUM15131]|uniref:hypothetical protein n=1 Tax=Acinetobacter sp. TUM15131 TaxID=2609141 RepID=UPI00124E44FD|nr:hypothetical protein [Acinetobacter sp. TUM15131]